MADKPLVITIMGPTASGKTALSLKLANDLPIEVINVDSAMVYKGMDIGTAKPSVEERQTVPHHLIDICEPTVPYSAGQFVRDVTAVIDGILKRNNIPVLVGGTMLYFRALQQGMADLPTADPVVRQRLADQVAENGLDILYQQLVSVDPPSAKQIKPTDTQRILRALEVYQISGKPLSQLQQEADKFNSPYRFINIGLWVEDRQYLHALIERRFNQMLKEGFEQEVKTLMALKGISANLPAMKSVGYRQMWSYLCGEYDHETMQAKAIVATRQLAKRQCTWLRSWPNLHRFGAGDYQPILALLSEK